MTRVLILGAGGHGQVVADILLAQQHAGEALAIAGFLDDNPALAGRMLMGFPVLGRIADLPGIPHDAVVVALGDNRRRGDVFGQLAKVGGYFFAARHPSAVVSPHASVAEGTVICARAVINPTASVGRNVIVNTACVVEHHVRVGDHAHLAPAVTLGGGATIGEGALVGIGATVLPRVEIGAWSTVGGGACVVRAVPAGVCVVGVPARALRRGPAAGAAG